MARGPKHPGLQQKFEHVLLELLADGRPLKARELVDGTSSLAAKFGISADELEDLGHNFANYASRAKDGGVIISGGPWGGYQLSSPAAVQGAAEKISSGRVSLAAPHASVPDATPTLPRQHWESFLHLPLTVALSAHFSSRVASLENAADNVRWGNPDMLMLRASPLSRVQEFDPSLEPSTFRTVDVSPVCILSSIEVKGGLERDRAKLFTAVAEAAANSRWANEAWLVFVDWESTEQGLDEDVVSLARSVEVGLLEVRLAADANVLQTVVHHAAPARATLRIGELTRERVGVLQKAQELLKLWSQDETTFLDVDRPEQKARLLLQQALGNLRQQKGFIAAASLTDLLQPLRAADDDRSYVDTMLKAALRAAAIAADLESEANLADVLAEAADNALIKKTADDYRGDLAAFGNVLLTKA
jgi:hypothetical protein